MNEWEMTAVADQMRDVLQGVDVSDVDIAELVEVARRAWWSDEQVMEVLGYDKASSLRAWCHRFKVKRTSRCWGDDVIAAKASMRGEGWRSGVTSS